MTTFRSLILLGLLALVSVPTFAQDGPAVEGLKLLELRETLIPFAEIEWEPSLRCLDYCAVIEIKRERYECSPVLAPPVIGCPLPWIDPTRPTPFPFPDPMEWCIPEELTLAGYHLFEDRSVVRQTIRHEGCQTSIEETVLKVLPDEGHPSRSCPDEVGPWSEERESTLSYRLTPCSG